MKAIVYTEYGSPDVLHLQDVEKPTPKENEILVKVYATPVNFGDLMGRKMGIVSREEFHMPTPLMLPVRLMFGYSKPRNGILGSEFAGKVEAVGNNVTRFKEGDPVFGYRGMTMGANAEYLCMPEDGLVTSKPANMTYAEAATIPYGAITALCLLRKANIQAGHKVLVNGASGAIGSHALQLAKYYGAEVTGVCGTERMDMVKALGADKVIDYTQEDFTQHGETYDLIFDVLGKSSFSKCKGSLTENGNLLLASFKTKPLFQMAWTSLTGGKKVICAMASENQEDIILTRELIEAGKITTVIDRCYPLAQTAEAHKYIESGQKKGNVVIVIAKDN